MLADLLTLEANSINDMSYQLEIDFGIGLRVDTKLTFNPSKNGFNVVNIIGHGSCICTKSGNRDENIWAIIDDDCIFSASDLTISGYNNAVENYGGIVIFNNVKFEENHMDYRIDRDWGAAILNGATCICNRCTFIKNECQNGGAIFNQGQLSLNNCTFKDNKAYSHGNDVLNADKGQVYVNGELINGSSGCVEYVKSIKTFGQVLIGILGTLGSITLGIVVGIFSLNPGLAIAAGAGVGMAIGIGCSAWILSMTFDMNFNRLTCFILVTAQCTLSGAFGGYIGNAMVTYCCAPAIVEQNIADISLLDSSFTSSESLSISELSSDVQELLKVWYTDAELDALIEQAEANEAANIINSMHSVKGTI